ncbi:sensor histidine kinase [Flagellimonas crocea]|uniref:sensor histidine kinase n=1 Tax=Flagellimonas crocea TaxID=3067311 RepID=UPI00296E7722|nr:histidine kinase [Muricauda sp. DH64]
MNNSYVALLFLLFISFFKGASISAQSVSDDRATKEIPTTYFKDTHNNLDIGDILGHDYSFEPFNHNSIDDLDATYWVRLDFKSELDTLETQDEWTLRTLNFGEATLYHQDKGTIQKKYFGKFNGSNDRLSVGHNNGVDFSKPDLIDSRYLYVKAKAQSFPRKVTFQYLSAGANRFYTQYYTQDDLRAISFHQLFLGACLIFFLTFLVMYFNIFRLEFLFYALYVLFLAIYLGGPYINPSIFDSRMGYWTIIISQVAINLFYVLFAIYYLDTRKNYPELHALLYTIVPILILLILADYVAFRLNEFMAKHYILTFQRVIMTVLGLFSMLYLLLKAKNKLAYFIVIGSFFYMMGALGFLFTLNQYLMIIGAVIEILLFSWALAYKIKQDYESKLNLQHQVSLKEITALRSQMNPHFIFNSLNSIQHLILKDDKVSALSYLSKFGKLTRNVLESSNMSTVTLDEEISLLKSYLELESLRFNNSFQYTIEIDENIDTKFIEVPLMLIQPFVENALIHGLIGKKEGEKILNLRFLKNGDFLVFQIEDNGIGRHHNMSESSKSEQKSHGMKITQKRLKMLDPNNQDKNDVEITDKFDANGNPMGTNVTIRIYNP